MSNLQRKNVSALRKALILLSSLIVMGGIIPPLSFSLKSHPHSLPSSAQKAAQVATSTSPSTKPTPTYKACHVCGDEAEEEPQVQALLFWMSTCGHCEYVLKEVLPPLEEQYKSRLNITKIEVTTMEDFDRLYQVAALYNIPKENVGVPFLVIGEHVLIGSRQIPQELPALIESYLAAGGVKIPVAVSAVFAELYSYDPSLTPTGNASSPPTTPQPQAVHAAATATSIPVSPHPATPQKLVFHQGFFIAAALELGLLSLFLWSVLSIFRPQTNSHLLQKPAWPILLFIFIGLGSALYLAYVEITAVQAVCGPVGDCNAVQQSPYSRLFGILPLGVLGVAAYLAMFVARVIARSTSAQIAHWAGLSLWGMALFGVGFSIYLTGLELFVIRAICAWCLTSALMMGLILLYSLPQKSAPEPTKQVHSAPP